MSALWRNAAHEYFVSGLLDDEHFVEVGPLVSVTTALKALDKSGPLVGWATRETAAAAIRMHEQLGVMIKESGPDAAQKWLQTKPGYIKDTAADLGSRAHMIAEAIAQRPGDFPRGRREPEGSPVPALRRRTQACLRGRGDDGRLLHLQLRRDCGHMGDHRRGTLAH